MTTTKRASKKKASKRSTKSVRLAPPPKPFQTCTGKCYSNLLACLERNPNNAQLCLRKFNLCVVGCIGPVFRP
jgi:hypothetical protein